MKEYIKANERSIKILIYTFLIGIVIGVMMYVLEPNIEKEKIVNSIKETMNLAKEDNFRGVNILINGFKSYIVFAIFLLFTSYTIITSYILITYMLIKGFSAGVFIATLINIFKVKRGIVAVICISIIPNIIYIPLVIFLILETIKLNESVISKNGGISKLLKYGIAYIATFPMYFLSLFLEQLLFKIVLNIYLKMIC